jgi:hypothetical protein
VARCAEVGHQPIFLLIINGLALALLVACWVVGDLEFRTKVILTVVYVLTWGLAFVEPLLLGVAQGTLAAVLWWATFGPRGRR